ncbi:MAG: hypothetical protein K0S54_2757 [Alphaproteobacteria bacterium]|nr:hypothetical protein [Alphaproteobacteria bacterium]
MHRPITRDKPGALFGILSRLVLATAATVAFANGAAAQTPAYPPENYAALLFDPVEVKHVFRLDGMPWICRGDTFCKPVKIDGVADRDLKQATIEPLGYAGRRYFLSYSQANLQKGRPVVLSCEDTRCEKLDAAVGPTSSLGVYQVKDGDRVLTRIALLRQLDERKGRAQLLWCSDSDCSEMPLTRDRERFLLSMGTGHKDGQNVAWLRDRSGEALSCAQAEPGISDQLTCTESTIRLSDFPTPQQQAAAPAPAAPPVVPAPPSNADRNALASTIDQAIAAGDFAYADRLLADANRRFARDATWTPLQQKLTRARAERDAQIRRAEAERLIDEAWRFARVGEFASAEAMLQDADKQAPGFADIARARQEIAELRTERRQRYRERYQYQAAIDQALSNEQLWEAERLLGDYGQRFSQDDEYRSRARRLDQMRSAAAWQARLTQARGFIANARQAMTRGEFAEAERQLERADRAAPGFPEINQARAELSRRRIAAERQQDEMRLLIAAIEASFQRRQYDEAERAIADGRRRYAGYPVWDELQGRSAAARRGDDRQGAEQRARTVRALELVTTARRSTTQGDFAAAERALTEANTLAPRLPELASANAELERAKADRARQASEIKAMQASIDAALQRKQYADAERLLADATKRYPTDAGWAPRTARLAEERRATPGQTGNAPMPAPAPATPPTQPPVAAAPPPATPAAPATPPAAAPKPDPSKPVADAKAAIARGDFPAAETAVSAAEKIDAKASAVVAVRKELNIARLVATARNNIRRQNFEAAEKAVADAEKIDAKDATVVKVRAELAAAENAPQQQRPNRRRD